MSNAELFIKYFLALLTATCEPFSMLLSTNQGTVIFLVVAWLGKFIWIASQVLLCSLLYINKERRSSFTFKAIFSLSMQVFCIVSSNYMHIASLNVALLQNDRV